MEFNEKRHAGILVAFYRALQCHDAVLGPALFLKGEQFYGERRGRRMALRALRDGRELNYKTYFQYGELLSTEGACDVSFSADEGCVAECVTRCPWADEFARFSCVACGIFYCKEIDAAVVRGFNPYLDYELLSNLHTTECCAFRHVCCAALRDDGAELMRQVDHFLVDAYGDAFVQALQQASNLDFEAIS